MGLWTFGRDSVAGAANYFEINSTLCPLDERRGRI